jgi:hypothetical protein
MKKYEYERETEERKIRSGIEKTYNFSYGQSIHKKMR